MKRRATVVRLLAVLSSVSLVAAYVSCRSEPETRQEEGPAEQAPPATFSGSKSAEMFPVQPTERTPAVMGGSKSRAVVTPQEVERKPQQPR